MKLLLDECAPRRLKNYFVGHDVSTIEQAGFKGLKNGNLLRAANGKFEVLITVDKNIEYQQNTAALPSAIVILAAASQSPPIAFAFDSKCFESSGNDKNRRCCARFKIS